MTLRNPKFGNSFTLNTGVQIKRTLDGSILVDTSRNDFDVLSMEFEGLTLAQRDGFLDFLESVAGEEIVMTDYEGQAWKGFILDPEPTLQNGRGCQYSCSLTFQGEKTVVVTP